jgi:DNA modification methylase
MSVRCAVTSPPYFGLRDYGCGGQIGLEPTPDQFVQAMVQVFREVRRVLRDDGTCWLNLGDSYNAAGRSGHGTRTGFEQGTNRASATGTDNCRPSVDHLKPKDLIGIPWMVAFALRADGWYLRQDIIWSKPNPMPESVQDRCTKAHEYLFLLSKSERYHFDSTAIQERAVTGWNGSKFTDERDRQTKSGLGTGERVESKFRNRRSVWTVTTKPFKGAHFATFPPDLIQPCILARCPRGGTVLDPFGGAGTTGLVAERLGRNSVLVELNEEYCQMARNRIRADHGKVKCSLLEAGRVSGPLFEDAAE